MQKVYDGLRQRLTRCERIANEYDADSWLS